ncbi:CpaE family protein [Vibrio zhugei]|uniref:CpaE family protein n=1 Tax=Vibrio zhugei TaxID=2479546 RepID=A0ABV7C5T3_9VIBR|nr:chromosome partitioning protein ParA [Vibrio zhugei]
MLDLVDILKSGKPDEKPSESITSALFYQTQQCRQLVLESYRFEGISEPVVAENTDADISEYVRLQTVEIVIIELNDSQNVAEDAKRISHLLPSHASVIVIGSEDAISTIRNLKELGFYYLFWPITKQELIDFVRSVHDNRQRNRGPGQNRRAKQVSVIGAKGGVGTTAISAELSYLLSEVKRASCIVVDHNYNSGNIDIMLGIKQFEKRQIQTGSFADTLDLASAKSLLYKQSELLSLLALTAPNLTQSETTEYHRFVVDIMSSECNFIIEDVSASSGVVFEKDHPWLKSDCIILITSPTVSSLRDAGRIKLLIENLPASERPRLIVVVNHIVPEKYASVSQTEIDKFLKQKADVVIPFISNFSDVILGGKRLANNTHKSSASFKSLASLVVGEDSEPSKSLFKKLFNKA